jgi:hypothetical protein
MAATLEVEQEGQRAAAICSQSNEDLSRRFGGLVVLEFLMNLFEDSPQELFGKIDILAVLEGVKNDRALFPEAVIAIWHRIGGNNTLPDKPEKSLTGPLVVHH